MRFIVKSDEVAMPVVDKAAIRALFRFARSHRTADDIDAVLRR